MISDQRIVFERLLSVIRSVSFPGPAVVQALDQEIQLITSMGAMLGGPYLPAINEQSLGISVPPCASIVPGPIPRLYRRENPDRSPERYLLSQNRRL
jgi:hypothetical protein